MNAVQIASTLSFLDRLQAAMRPDACNLRRHLEELIGCLNHLREKSLGSEWDWLISRIREHPIREVLFQDPLTHRAYTKPRGYSGDAVSIDYVYRIARPPRMSRLGSVMFAYNITRHRISKGARYRRQMIARRIDDAAQHSPHGLRVLSVACGHLREAELSGAIRGRQIAAFTAMDQDAQSLRVVDRCYGGYGIRTMAANVASARVMSALEGSRYDLIYGLGLYDYLPEPLAKTLTQRLFGLLASGGSLLFGNCLPGNEAAGYMETFMDWTLVYRSEAEIAGLTMDLPPDEVQSRRTFQDPFGAIAYCEVQRA